MTQKHRTNRRTYMKTLGILGATGLGSTGLVTANGKGNGKKKGKRSLADIPVNFNLYFSIVDDEDNDPDETNDYGYPGDFTGLPDNAPQQGDESGLFFAARNGIGPDFQEFFNTSEIKITSNGQTLHHNLQFFNGLLMTDMTESKPYILSQTNPEGRYVSRGQTMNIETVTNNILGQRLHKIGLDGAEQLPPFNILTGDNVRKWRVVGDDRIQLDKTNRIDDGSSDDPVPLWGLTRADFYSRGNGRPTFKLSLLYVVWHADLGLSIPDQGDKNANQVTIEELIETGRLNLGGQ